MTAVEGAAYVPHDPARRDAAVTDPHDDVAAERQRRAALEDDVAHYRAALARLRSEQAATLQRALAAEGGVARLREILSVTAERLAAEVAAVRRQNADLLAANNRLLARARDAEALTGPTTPERLEVFGKAAIGAVIKHHKGELPDDGLTIQQAIGRALLREVHDG